jgi:hypothetical protein
MGRIDWYGDSAFDVDKGDRQAAETIKVFTCQLPAIYMMANQFSLLGLASAGTVANIIGTDPKNVNKDAVRAFLPEFAGADASNGGRPASISCGQSSQDKAAEPPLKSAQAHDAVAWPAKPTFVAFTDSNDLLSWPIRSDMDQGNFAFFNVYVDNKLWHWFGLFEDPGDAHSGYFRNKQVGALMECGVDNSEISKSCATEAR